MKAIKKITIEFSDDDVLNYNFNEGDAYFIKTLNGITSVPNEHGFMSKMPSGKKVLTIMVGKRCDVSEAANLIELEMQRLV